MKYVWIFVAVVFLVRIDLVVNFIEQTVRKFGSSRSAPVNATEVASNSEIVPMNKDLSLKSSPRKDYLSSLNDFQATPEVMLKDRAIDVLRANPKLFGEKLDKELESGIYGLRDLMIQRNKVTHQFLLESMKFLEGENLVLIKKVLSIAIDQDLVEFLNLYANSSDITCSIIGYLPDQHPPEEMFNELSERLPPLEAFLRREKIEPMIRIYADKCLTLLRLEIEKIKLTLPPDPSIETPVEAGPVP